MALFVFSILYFYLLPPLLDLIRRLVADLIPHFLIKKVISTLIIAYIKVCTPALACSGRSGTSQGYSKSSATPTMKTN